VVALPSEEEEALRRQISHKNYLKRMRTSLINRLYAIFLDGGIVDKKRGDLATAKRRQEALAELSGALREAAEASCRLLETVETELAAAFLAHVGDGSRFSRPAEVANYVALVPTLDCSGQSGHYGHIGKRKGCRALRSVILQSAWSLMKARDGGRLQTKFFLMRERIGKTRSAVTIARRIVGLMWVLVRRRELYADATREGLERKFRHYKVNYGGWEPAKKMQKSA
jgi:transposase